MTYADQILEHERAQKKAMAFLKSIIGDYEYRRMQRDGYFLCHGSDGRRYRIYAEGSSHNIVEVSKDNVDLLDNLCVHLGYGMGRDRYGYETYMTVPDPDHWAGQYLGLLCDAPTMRRIAYKGGPRYAIDWVRSFERRRSRGVR